MTTIANLTNNGSNYLSADVNLMNTSTQSLSASFSSNAAAQAWTIGPVSTPFQMSAMINQVSYFLVPTSLTEGEALILSINEGTASHWQLNSDNSISLLDSNMNPTEFYAVIDSGGIPALSSTRMTWLNSTPFQPLSTDSWFDFADENNNLFLTNGSATGETASLASAGGLGDTSQLFQIISPTGDQFNNGSITSVQIKSMSGFYIQGGTADQAVTTESSQPASYDWNIVDDGYGCAYLASLQLPNYNIVGYLDGSTSSPIINPAQDTSSSGQKWKFKSAATKGSDIDPIHT